MSYKIYTTSVFDKDVKSLAKKYPSFQSDLAELFEQLSVNPFSGESLGKDCYKIRFAIASKGKGKRGGGRAISCVKVVQNKIYLVKAYDKSEQDTIGKDELKSLLEISGLL